MNTSRLLGAVLAAGLGVSAIMGTSDALAQKRTTPTKQVTTVAPRLKGTASLSPRTLRWGMSFNQVVNVYERVIDEDFRPQYKKVSPGVQMQRLDAEVAEAKNELRRGRIDFGQLPTTIDGTPLRGEYTYNNSESLLSLTRGKTTRHMFFIQDKLWKIIDEYSLGEEAEYGKDFTAAVTKLAKSFGVAGRVIPADPEKQQYSTVVDWEDPRSHIRAIERGSSGFALVMEESATLARIESLRPNKPADLDAIDPDVASIIRRPEAPPGPPKGGK